MSTHPTERVRTVAEMQATSLQQSDKALRRMAAAEERLARLEGRLAEKDQLIAEFHEAYGRQADTISALTAVVRELESKVGRGVDQVLTGLEGRIKHLEGLSHDNPVLSVRQIRAEAVDAMVCSDGFQEVRRSIESLQKRASFAEVAPPLPAKRKRGRPKGSKNKPKDTPPVEVVARQIAEDNAQGDDYSNLEASEDMKSRYTGADSE